MTWMPRGQDPLRLIVEGIATGRLQHRPARDGGGRRIVTLPRGLQSETPSEKPLVCARRWASRSTPTSRHSSWPLTLKLASSAAINWSTSNGSGSSSDSKLLGLRSDLRRPWQEGHRHQPHSQRGQARQRHRTRGIAHQPRSRAERGPRASGHAVPDVRTGRGGTGHQSRRHASAPEAAPDARSPAENDTRSDRRRVRNDCRTRPLAIQHHRSRTPGGQARPKFPAPKS
jgi:hypothetical protein